MVCCVVVLCWVVLCWVGLNIVFLVDFECCAGLCVVCRGVLVLCYEVEGGVAYREEVC